MIEDLGEDIKAITGQEQDVLCISYQTACHTSYGRYPGIAIQQQELAAEYGQFIRNCGFPGLCAGTEGWLVLDTGLVRQQPDGNYGFQIYCVDEQPGKVGSIAQAETKITGVRLVSEDSVELLLSRAPQSGERLTYGVNGDYWQNICGVKNIMSGGEGEDGYTKAGRNYGSRGNIRDSQPLKNTAPGAVFRDLYKWCVIFEVLF